MYTTDELTKAARKLFGASPAAVYAALKLTGKNTFGLDEAKRIVRAFLIREVKPNGTNLAAGR